MNNPEQVKNTIKKETTTEGRLDQIENALVEEITFRKKQAESLGINIIQLKKTLQSITDGKSVAINRNILIDKVNQVVNQYNRFSVEVAQMRAELDKCTKRIEELESKFSK